MNAKESIVFMFTNNFNPWWAGGVHCLPILGRLD